MKYDYRVSVGGTVVKRSATWAPLLIEFMGLSQRGYRPVLVNASGMHDGAVYGGRHDTKVTAEWRTITSNIPAPDWAQGIINAVEAAQKENTWPSS